MNKMLEYLGYHAKIEFDAEDGLLIGEVFGVRDSLNFHATSIVEIEEMFHQCVDNYLQMCRELGETPEREFKGSFNIRMTPELHREAALEAEKKGCTLNQFIADAIKQTLHPKDSCTYICMSTEIMKNIERYGNNSKTVRNKNSRYVQDTNTWEKKEVISIG